MSGSQLRRRRHDLTGFNDDALETGVRYCVSLGRTARPDEAEP